MLKSRQAQTDHPRRVQGDLRERRGHHFLASSGEAVRPIGLRYARNDLIFNDVLSALDAGRSPVVITERKDHLQAIAEREERVIGEGFDDARLDIMRADYTGSMPPRGRISDKRP